MRILVEYPPLYKEIVQVFPTVRDGGVIFAWGDIIYNPDDIPVSRELVEHEQIHSVQQGNNPPDWWRRYLIDALFRYAQELPAHAAEYRAYCARHGNHRKRQTYLMHVAQKLASPLYGGLTTPMAARSAILAV